MGSIGAAGAFWGGFSSFFSVWQACILQVSPFFIAFATGLYFVTLSGDSRPGFKKRVLAPCLLFGLFFSIGFAVVNSSGLGLSRLLNHNIHSLRFAAGALIVGAGVYIILSDGIRFIEREYVSAFHMILASILGPAFSLVYMPCVTPTLSKILGLAVNPATVPTGTLLAFVYALGLSLALSVAAISLILALKLSLKVTERRRAAKYLCGLVLALLGVLNLTGYMVYYKSTILGLLTR